MRVPVWLLILVVTGLIGLSPLTATAKMIAVAVSVFLTLKVHSLHSFLLRGRTAS